MTRTWLIRMILALAILSMIAACSETEDTTDAADSAAEPAEATVEDQAAEDTGTPDDEAAAGEAVEDPGTAAATDDSGGEATGDPIPVGAVLSLTGAGAGLGVPERAGIELAVEEINAAGGVDGRPLEVMIEDDASSPDSALSLAQSLVNDEGVVALIGASLTASTDAIASMTNEMSLPQIAFTGLGPPIEREWQCLYHVLPPQALNARAMLEYATQEAGAQTIGVLHDSGYGQAVMDALNSQAAEYDVEFVETQQADVAATDVTTQAAQVRAAEPDIVFVVSTNPIFFRGAREAGLEGTLVSAIGSASYEYIEGMGQFANDVVFEEFLVGEDPLPRQEEFVSAFQEANGELPKNFEAAGYDAVNVLVDGLEEAGPEATPEELCEGLRTPHEGVLANYDFSQDDMTGIELSSIVYSYLEDGEFTRLDFSLE